LREGGTYTVVNYSFRLSCSRWSFQRVSQAIELFLLRLCSFKKKKVKKKEQENFTFVVSIGKKDSVVT
jgi:hypothetical protein